MAGETGVDREGPSPRAPLIPFPGCDPGDPIYNENGPFLLLLDCFSAIAIIVQVVWGPLGHSGTLFLEGPQGLVPSTSRIISPALTRNQRYCTQKKRSNALNSSTAHRTSGHRYQRPSVQMASAPSAGSTIHICMHNRTIIAVMDGCQRTQPAAQLVL